MTDDRKLPDLGDVDWDQALSEWEENTFVPEMARDRETNRTASPTAAPPSKALYQPAQAAPPAPSAQPANAARPQGPSHAPSHEPSHAPAQAPSYVPAHGAVELSELSDDDSEEQANQTVIARIPKELLRGAGRAEEGPKSARGGLGQLFGKTDKRGDSEGVDVQVDLASSANMEVAAKSSYEDFADLIGEDPSVATSVATSVGSSAGRVPAGGRSQPPSRAASDRPSVSTVPPPADVDTSGNDAADTGSFASRLGDAFDPFAPSEPPTAPLEIVSESDPEESDLDALMAAPLAPEPTDEPEPTDDVLTSGPALLRPHERRFDPNEETSVLSKAELRSSIAKAEAAKALAAGLALDEDPDDHEQDVGEDPTQLRRRKQAAQAEAQARDRVSWEDEKPAPAWLDEAMAQSFRRKAAFLEAEARSAQDRPRRARGLLAASELRAITGDRDGALALAREAREISPSVPLTHTQVRGMLDARTHADELLDALDLESRSAATPLTQTHAELIAADVLRLAGEADLGARRWDTAFYAAQTDVRAPTLRAANALARGEHASVSLALGGVAELAPLSQGIELALRLRGAERRDAGENPPVPNESLRRARAAIGRGDLAAAATAVAEIRSVPELSSGTIWLAASLAATRATSRPEAIGWLQSLADRGDRDAARQLAARSLELGDSAGVGAAIGMGDFQPAERAVLSTLAGFDVAEGDLAAAAEAGAELRPLVAALSAGRRNAQTDDADARAQGARDAAARVAGDATSQAAARLARLIAGGGAADDIGAAARGVDDGASGYGRFVALEMAVRRRQASDVSAALEAWPTANERDESGEAPKTPWAHAVAAGMVAEQAGDPARAREAYRAARAADATDLASLRAAAALDPNVDLALELNTLADDLDSGPRSAIARLEAIARSEGIDDATRRELLERAQRAAPAIPIAAFLAENIARHTGDSEEILRWVRERRAASEDPVERSLDAVREARLIAATDPELARERLEEATRARPDDAGLRELAARAASTPPEARASWEERRAEKTSGETRAVRLTRAAYDYEQAGFADAALRSALGATSASGSPLARIVLERAELATGHIDRLASGLVDAARAADDATERRGAQQRLAELELLGSKDGAGALTWHRALLADDPTFLPSLRQVEHALVTEGRSDELEPVAAAIARVLAPEGDADGIAHAELAIRLRMRGIEGDWDGTREMADLAASRPGAPLASLRLRNAHARARGDDAAYLASTLELLDRVVRPQEVAVLCLRASEAAARLGDLAQARGLLERAKTIDAGDVVTWGMLADVCQREGDLRGAAEACESLARTSVVSEHQLLAWYDAGRIWLDEVSDTERGIVALEHASVLDVTFQDTFERLAAIYADRGLASELAHLLDRRIATITDDSERVDMEVERAKALVQVGYLEAARSALSAALEARPDHPSALTAYGELCARQEDWEGAEQAWVRLARLVATPEEQRDIYGRLGALYSDHTVNLSRAELAFREVLKRAPEDVPTRERLVDVYRRQNDVARAVEAQSELVQLAKDPASRRARVLELAEIYEATGHDVRRTEQTLDQARKEFPTDVTVLRAMVNFYLRHNQRPATQIMLDRAAGDARRAFAAGRFSVPLFEMMAAVADLRNKKDAAAVAEATLAAYEGRIVEIRGAEAKAADARLDELLAPELMTPAFRMLLAKTGDALDAASPADVRALAPTPLSSSGGGASFGALVSQLAGAFGLGAVQVLVTPRLGRSCVAVSSSPPTILAGEALVASSNEPARAFLVMRALKLVHAKASALVRATPADLPVLVAAWLKVFNPTWSPAGVNAPALADAGKRIQAALPRGLDADVGVMALEVVGSLGTQMGAVGASAVAWANRCALLAIGNPSAALDGIAWASGLDSAPTGARERAAWISETVEARELLVFGVSDSYADARARVGLAPVNAPPPLRKR